MVTNQQSLAERLKRDSHRICSLILNTDISWIDIAIEINHMREVCETEAPEKLELFEAIYVSRFTRLWQQWRGDAGECDATGEFGEPDFSGAEDNDEGWGLASA